MEAALRSRWLWKADSGFRNRPAVWSSESGAVLVAVLVVGLMLVVMAAGTLPDRVRRKVHDTRVEESLRLERLSKGIEEVIRRSRQIPGTGSWVGAVSDVLNVSTSEVRLLRAPFSSQPGGQRVLLVSPNFTPTPTGAGIFTQSVSGISQGAGDVPTADSRLMLVSSSNPGLALPVSEGSPSLGEFNAVWDWKLDLSTKAPPSGWPSSWGGQGESLHVHRLSVSNYFHLMSFSNVLYRLDGGALQSTASTQASRFLLEGTLLEVFSTSTNLLEARVITAGGSFSRPGLSVSVSSTNTFWLTGTGLPTDPDGVPAAALTNTAPSAATLPNYDPGRDSEVGVFIHKGGSGISESDTTRYQLWISEAGGMTISGTVTLTLYTAMKDFRDDKGGRLVVYLMTCSASGGNRTSIASKTLSRYPWDTGSTGSWIQETITFNSISTTVATTKRLGLMVIVDNDSDDDMLLAYGCTANPSRILLP